MKLKARVYTIFLFWVLLTQTGLAQQDSLSGPLWSPLIKSALVPGWGQMEQYNPGRAVILYGLGNYMLYNTIFNYHRYEVTDNSKYKNRSRNFLRLYALIYSVNLIDILNTHFNHKYHPWDGSMFTDKPIKSPWGAVARSAMMPGWGQLYNEQYIKAIIVFAVFFEFSRKVYVFNNRYEKTGNPSMRDQRVTNTWYLGLIYLLNMVDAYVDATLYRFDDTMELTYYIWSDEDTFYVGTSFVF